MYQKDDKKFDYVFKPNTKDIGKILFIFLLIFGFLLFMAYRTFDISMVKELTFKNVFGILSFLFFVFLGIGVVLLAIFLYKLAHDAILKINKEGIYLHPLGMVYWGDVEIIETQKKCYLCKGPCLFLKLKEGVDVLKRHKGFKGKLYSHVLKSILVTPQGDIEINKDMFMVDLQELLKILKEYHSKYRR